LSASILTIEEAILRFGRDKRNGRRVVFTNGCFDLLHPGHLRGFELARELGDVLIVGLNSDASVRQLKGPGRPVIPERERAEILAALESVDAVIIFDELTPREVISRLLPDVLVKGGDWPGDQIVGREEVEAAGGRVVSVPLVPGYSTSAILQKIREGFGPSSVNTKPQPEGARVYPERRGATRPES
jgi:D-beta-D-heptose 7-phosphate kinase/D-beta-D-heptose 1-phosphate adenosyltransferase